MVDEGWFLSSLKIGQSQSIFPDKFIYVTVYYEQHAHKVYKSCKVLSSSYIIWHTNIRTTIHFDYIYLDS